MILILNDFEERAYIPVAINSYCTVSTNVEIKRIGRYFTAHYFLISVSILRQTVEEIKLSFQAKQVSTLMSESIRSEADLVLEFSSDSNQFLLRHARDNGSLPALVVQLRRGR